MAKQTHIYRVSFREPVGGKTDYFFGSLSAIFAAFTTAQIGCGVRRLWNIGITTENPYNGRKCSITKEPLTRKRQNHAKEPQIR
ncbi:hypothetical protein [Alistipes sp.]|uniref:hypothetical protein n=1 Tax=Alistipes sp. TaxID=1872444 RepID=UPI003526C728